MSIQDKIANDLKKIGGHLVCNCGLKKELKQSDISRYVSEGWPKCCGLTMRWITKNELKEEVQ